MNVIEICHSDFDGGAIHQKHWIHLRQNMKIHSQFTGKSSHEGPDSGTTKNEYLSHFMTIGSVAAEIYASGQMEDQTHQHHITNYREIIMFHLFLLIEKNTSR